MATFTCLHEHGLTGQEFPGGWTPIVSANLGDAVRELDLGFAQAQNGVCLFDDLANSPGFFPGHGMYEPSGLSAASVITNIDVHIWHEWLDPVNPLADVFLGFTESAFGNRSGFISVGGFAPLGGQREDIASYPLNPWTGVPWVYDDIFTANNNSGTDWWGTFIVNPVEPTGHPYSSYRINTLWLVVTASSPTPTEVDVVGAGGVLVGGAAPITRQANVVGAGGVDAGGDEAVSFGIGAGQPPELHLNQWGLYRIDVEPVPAERV